MFRSRKWHEEEEQDEDAADEVKKKWEPGVKIGSETDVEQTEKGNEREKEGGRKEKEFNAQSKWSEIWFLKKMLRGRADIFQHFCFV